MIKHFRYSKLSYLKVIFITIILYVCGSILYNFFPNVIIAILSLIITFLYFGIMIRKYRKSPIIIDTKNKKIFINTKAYNEEYNEYSIKEIESFSFKKKKFKIVVKSNIYEFHTKIENIEELLNLIQGDENEG
ncbi:hypothetical protein OSSY52_11720 [Tepiditoga spiralis]|uniref:Uncharacterized protein n=1 Tax=Tepiditoga spiralis TaxID=2108365 RepID=A0A7G1G3X9_9BACT|nr:hypothetical protein [Tepiditoga spiralis]BBE31031.1 hypothetical protein OSSY52_11720 [Tepiditoga spiralis]